MRKTCLLGFMFLTWIAMMTNGELAQADESTNTQPRLVERWQSSEGLQVPESVICDTRGKILYVSNICGSPGEKNGQGFISKMTVKGTMINLKWATGLNAPKGMAIYGHRLFVSDIDRLVEIALADGEIVAEYPAPGANFLNDVAADATGRVYVSDSSSGNSMIYRLDEGLMTSWIRGPEISKPNGLFMEGDRLLVGNSGDGSIKAIDLASEEITTVAVVGSGIDGLQPDGKGNYFISDWSGETSFVTRHGDLIVLMDTTASNINSADLCYIKKKKLLVIPTFFDNRVVAYKVKRSGCRQ